MEATNGSWLMQFIRPALDIGLLWYLLCKVYTMLEETRGMHLIRGLASLGVLFAIVLFLKLKTMLWILNLLGPGIVVGLAIVFQPELRNIFIRVGRGELLRFRRRTRFSHIDVVLKAAEMISQQQRGMLLVFARDVGLRNIVETGTRLNADLSTSLLLTIFSYATPLHDGAVVLNGGKIEAAGCFLPLSKQGDISRSFGTRHRAGLGLAEESDAIMLIVSEETGAISLAYNARLFYDLSLDVVRMHLKRLLDLRGVSGERDGKRP